MPESEDIALCVRGVSRSFGELRVLNSISFSVCRGEFAVLMGPNGCGKTTLLRIIAGVLQPDDGEVEIPAAGDSGGHGSLAMVFQQPLLLPWLSIEKNITLPLMVNGRKRSAASKDVTDLLELAGLADRRRDTPEGLSGGEKQKVAILRALVQNPSVLVLDEPFSALDPDAHAHLQEYLLNIWTARATTILFVTHDLEEAAYLGDRVLVLTRKPASVQQDLRVALSRPRPQAEDPERESIVLHLRRALIRS
jgi:NitT/TauT family transport system ATP-binding protein